MLEETAVGLAEFCCDGWARSPELTVGVYEGTPVMPDGRACLCDYFVGLWRAESLLNFTELSLVTYVDTVSFFKQRERYYTVVCVVISCIVLPILFLLCL